MESHAALRQQQEVKHRSLSKVLMEFEINCDPFKINYNGFLWSHLFSKKTDFHVALR